MYIVHVAVQVKENKIDTFVDVVEDNRKNSLKEEGVLQFDVFQDTKQKNHFFTYRSISNTRGSTKTP
ncbi:antibiotic biosynthesis monooxygenase [Salipaludibacillus neizhouensis]|nr:antibiotic biosynthesis monooxygenase [Salipaludibacillus neizhouensis]